MELVHSVCSCTGMMIPSLHRHWSSFLYADLSLTGTDLRECWTGKWSLCVIWYSSPGSVPIPLNMWWFLFKMYSFMMGRLCLFPFMITSPLSHCTLGHFRSCPLLLVYLCLGAFATMAFRCACVVHGCLNFGGVILKKKYVADLLDCLITKNKAPSCVCDLENRFLWHLTSRQEYCCTWPLVDYRGVIIPADEHCRRPWSLVFKQQSIDMHGNDVAPYSLVGLSGNGEHSHCVV